MDETDRGDFDPLRQGEQAAPVEPLPQDVDTDLQAAAEDVKKYDRGVPPDYHKKSGNKRTVLILLAVILTVALIAAGSYWFLSRHKNSKPPAATQSSSKTNSSGATSPEFQSTFNSDTKSYTSANFGLAFSYPSNWIVTDVAGSGVLKATSAPVQLSSGIYVAVLTIRDKTQSLSEFSKGNATALRDSQKIAYTKPTQTQRGSTYISFLAYPGTTSFSGVYITGDNGYQKGQAVPQVDIAKVDPVISITFLQTGKQTNIPDSMIDNTGFMTPLINILKSLSIN